jgi:DNA polymerase-3 subunit beta
VARLGAAKEEDMSMQFSIEAKALSTALGRVIGVVQHKSSRPILTCVLITADADGALHIESTNTDISVSVHLSATVNKAGRIAIPARKFSDYLSTLSDGMITLSSDDQGMVQITAVRGQGEIAGQAGSDFPLMQSFDDAKFASISSSDMKRVLTQTVRCASTDDSRFALVGVYVHAKEDGLRFVATDGHRLAVARPAAEFDWSVPSDGMILPSRGVDELRKLLDGQDNISIAVVGNHTVARSDDQTICMRLTDGTFPNYEQVIPKSNDKAAVVDRGQLLAALRSVSVFSSLKTSQVEITFNSGTLVISSVSDSGMAREELPCDYDGDELRIGFNHKYLRDALESVGGSAVMFRMGDHLAPAVVMPEGNDHYLCVIMPMRL